MALATGPDDHRIYNALGRMCRDFALTSHSEPTLVKLWAEQAQRFHRMAESSHAAAVQLRRAKGRPNE